MNYGGGFGVNFMFDVFPFIFMIVFLIILCVVIINLVRGVGIWNKNNHAPVLTVEAAVVAKRISVRHHHNNTGDSINHTSNSTFYYATFQVDSGDRFELAVSGSDYGMLVEGDKGKLTFQGTRLKEFKRN
ncbi:DUF2500 domain-containing protein [Clostridium culturomicium]|uniref:DUF2500 domain-containing protein n=1 Tax=Clostridium culturomicium TaxID=1499683 RepID=UPI0038579351